MDCLDCIVVGDVFLDITVRVDSHPRLSFSGGTSYCSFIKPTLGGSGNVAVGVSTLGGKAAFVGKAGNDLFGKLYAQDLVNQGVLSKVFFDKGSPTGLILVFVNDNERSFLVFRGANDQLSISEIGEATDLIRKSEFIYFCGYSLVNNPQKNSILETIKSAKELGAKIVFDPGAYNLITSKRELFQEILGFCDIVSLNFDEAQALTEKNRLDDVIKELRQTVPLTAIKCGQNGSVLIDEGNIVRTKSYPVKCVDPTGAGDAFTSALIYGITHQLRLDSVAQLANWFAAQVVTGVGARNFPSKRDIDHYLKNRL